MLNELTIGDRVRHKDGGWTGTITRFYAPTSIAVLVDGTNMSATWHTSNVVKIEVDTGGVKADDGKPMMDLLDPAFLEGTAQVLTFGAKKYAPHNWRKGIKASRLIAACLRHLCAIMRGEDLDKETGLHHGYHLACEVMFLTSMLTTRKDMDDRYKLTNPRREGTDLSAKEESGGCGMVASQAG